MLYLIESGGSFVLTGSNRTSPSSSAVLIKISLTRIESAVTSFLLSDKVGRGLLSLFVNLNGKEKLPLAGS